MKIPFPNELPDSVRAVSRRLLSARFRARLAADWHHWAHMAYRGHPEYRRSLTALKAEKGRYRNKSCVIIGNGPSIRDLDLSRFRDVDTFCLNRGYLLWRDQNLTPTFLLAVNDLVIEQFHQEMIDVGCPLYVPWQHHQLFRGAPQSTFVETRWHERFFEDLKWGLWPGSTVTFAALQLAYHMGFSTAVLVGVDHRFKDQGPAHKEIVQEADDPNHFAANYFGKGVRWNLPDLDGSEFAYRLALQAYVADERRIIDATKNGALQVFPKIELDEVFQQGIL